MFGEILERLAKGRGLPVGTVRKRKDGEYVKQSDGSWKRKGTQRIPSVRLTTAQADMLTRLHRHPDAAAHGRYHADTVRIMKERGFVDEDDLGLYLLPRGRSAIGTWWKQEEKRRHASEQAYRDALRGNT